MIEVTAVDDTGRKIRKLVTYYVSTWSGKDIISFAPPIEYYAEDLEKHYPYKKPFCIDMGGRNHYDSPVNIAPEDMDRIVEDYRENKKAGLI